MVKKMTAYLLNQFSMQYNIVRIACDCEVFVIVLLGKILTSNMIFCQMKYGDAC